MFLTKEVPPRNALLRALPPAELAALGPRLEPVALSAYGVLLRPDGPIEAVHFVEAGTVSMISTLQDGAQIEVGLIGPEGLVGLPLLLGVKRSPLEAMVQVDGEALRLSAAGLRAGFAELPSLRPLLLRYVEAFHAQVTQTAACNGRHRIDQRLARWTLMTQDRVGEDHFLLTQEFLARMLGVQRPSVTLAVATLSRAGLVRHARGVMHVLDRAGLEAATCECYGLVRRHYERLTRPPGD